MSFATDPAGATVYRKEYNATEDAWEVLGLTPLDSIHYPLGLSLLRFELEGYRTAYASVAHWYPLETLELQPVDVFPEDRVWIPGGTFEGLDYPLGPYVLDRYEVTNRQYKAFVDSGGYRTPDYWTDPIVVDGRELTWSEAMALLVDRTGRRGPSTWEIGDYPIGQDDYPVTGVSWYEARAYARFAGRDLPTFHHWRNASRAFNAPWLLPASNIDGESLAAVGHHRGVGRYGNLDLAGNAREWVFNAADDGTRYILGDAWDDASYGFFSAVHPTAEPFNRSSSNGFRLVTYLDSINLDLAMRPVLQLEYPDYRHLQPVSDEVFEAYRDRYEYDRLSATPVVEAIDTSRNWIRERISYDVAYREDPAVVYVYLPKTGQRPLQSVVYWPGGNALRLDHIDQYRGFNIDFVVRSGRALLFPVYTATFERRMNTLPDWGSNAYEAMVIEWTRQTRSAVDLVYQRDDLDDTRVAYYGWSWGGRMGPVALALEPRFVTGILEVAGLRDQGQPPAADPFNFVSRVTQPVLMLNGKYDNSYPYDASALPLYELLGTNPEHKMLVAGETDGHNLPRDQVIRETLAWLDRYLGPVSR
ncbi:MAG: SUMF1/EgtB/PvdO family nonheme iron enzyme [Gemmatimonadota bacterium]|nr:MAG: SUMF1/EgtB/PvdO family nonheme iron enzyme [Gemmatimonadota bacterium]